MDPIITLATVPAVVALVNLAKAFGVTGKWSALAAVVLGVGISLATTYADADVVRTVSDGLILGLGAAGLYDVSTGHRETTGRYADTTAPVDAPWDVDGDHAG